MTHIVIGDLKHFIKANGTKKAAAKKLRISPQYLNDVLTGRRDVTEKLAKKLGWKLQKTWIYEGKP